MAVVVLILFAAIVAGCAAQVYRLAKDARADVDSERNVFDRRREARLVALRRTGHALRMRLGSPGQPGSLVDGPTVRLTPVARPRDRDYPTIPAMSGR